MSEDITHVSMVGSGEFAFRTEGEREAVLRLGAQQFTLRAVASVSSGGRVVRLVVTKEET